MTGMVREAVTDSGTVSSSRLFLAIWLGGMLVAYFAVMALIAMSPVVEVGDDSVFRWEWARFAGGFQWGALTFGGLVINYLGNKITGAAKVKNGHVG